MFAIDTTIPLLGYMVSDVLDHGEDEVVVDHDNLGYFTIIFLSATAHSN